MSKVLTVKDIGSTLHHLNRLGNYAYRHMDDVAVAEANEPLAKARDTLKELLTEFEGMDVTTLTADNTEVRREIDRLKRERDYYKNEIADYEQTIVEIVAEAREQEDENPDISWEENQIEDFKGYRKDLKVRIKELKKEL